MPLREVLAANIKNARNNLRLTQEQLAQIADISVTNIRSLEHFRANPRLDTLERLAAALGMSVPELFYEHRETK